VKEGVGHEGAKPAQVVYLRNGHLFTTGFSKMGDRQMALWDAVSCMSLKYFVVYVLTESCYIESVKSTTTNRYISYIKIRSMAQTVNNAMKILWCSIDLMYWKGKKNCKVESWQNCNKETTELLLSFEWVTDDGHFLPYLCLTCQLLEFCYDFWFEITAEMGPVCGLKQFGDILGLFDIVWHNITCDRTCLGLKYIGIQHICGSHIRW